jgi:hypothetical protein
MAKIFPHSVGSLLSLETASFAVQKLFSLMQYNLFLLDKFFLLDIEPFEFYLGNHSLYLLFQGISYYFL